MAEELRAHAQLRVTVSSPGASSKQPGGYIATSYISYIGYNVARLQGYMGYSIASYKQTPRSRVPLKGPADMYRSQGAPDRALSRVGRKFIYIYI